MTDPIQDFSGWSQRLLEIRDPATYSESLEFCRLVEAAAGLKNAQVARALFMTFTNKPDYGVKETVVRILATFDLNTYYEAYLNELPRMVLETRDQGWYFLLATYPGKESMERKDCDHLVEIVKTVSAPSRREFISLISRTDFLYQNKWAEYVTAKLEAVLPAASPRENPHGE